MSSSRNLDPKLMFDSEPFDMDLQIEKIHILLYMQSPLLESYSTSKSRNGLNTCKSTCIHFCQRDLIVSKQTYYDCNILRQVMDTSLTYALKGSITITLLLTNDYKHFGAKPENKRTWLFCV